MSGYPNRSIDPTYANFQPIESNSLLKGMFEHAGIKFTSSRTWNELEALFQSTASGFMTIVRSIQNTLPNLYVLSEARINEINKMVAGFNRDIEFQSTELAKIHARHLGKTGFIANEDEFAQVLSIFEDYNAWNEVFKQTSFQMSLFVSEMAVEAQEIIRKGAAQSC